MADIDDALNQIDDLTVTVAVPGQQLAAGIAGELQRLQHALNAVRQAAVAAERRMRPGHRRG